MPRTVNKAYQNGLSIRVDGVTSAPSFWARNRPRLWRKVKLHSGCLKILEGFRQAAFAQQNSGLDCATDARLRKCHFSLPKQSLDKRVRGRISPPVLPLPVPAEILRICRRGNCKEDIFAQWIFPTQEIMRAQRHVRWARLKAAGCESSRTLMGFPIA